MKNISFNINSLYLKVILAFTGVIASSASANALTFNFNYAQGTTLEQMVGFEMAGGIWSSHLSDNASVNIYVEMTNDLPTNVIGGALPGIAANQTYTNWRNNLQADITSADDTSIFNNLQDEVDKFTAYIDGFKVDNNEELNMTRANAKALGMLNGNNNALDGYILMSNLSSLPVSWNYDFLNNTVPNNKLDFLSVGVHEVGHILGFVSGIDRPGWLSQKTQYNQNNIDDFYSSLTGTLNNVTPLDMFRYSQQSVAAGGVSENWLDLSIGGNPYFSVDGGQTSLAYFATGENTSLGGDGEQASHWKQESNVLGIMDPLLNVGQRRSITTIDRRAMDAIGWDLGQGNINYTTLHGQAKERLAQRIGKTVAWLDANPIAAAQLLSQNRDQDVATMIDQSQIYEWGPVTCIRGTPGCWRQEGFWQNYSWQTLNTQGKATKTPEPSSFIGLLGLVGLGLVSRKKLSRPKPSNNINSSN
ncbi:hypothetical protein DSM106972_057910 [Dulcicalothrix desertica PCC 7102]|uniref:Ice-binding protein C-terminal domain-containing protein n=1 Tax=Dulcicalothrix desertica PCC 7102 TaxID=232991 RepID=A0A433V9U3_9CYAN|nr:NF038122 family metalloprotease [Dulcicalothrix desertica]RUT02871.1 hypothetical protein DSM106972_057910 [Dulcicalothrix desertica PCC 7102]TWH38898.1 putative secreted protein with PEP-CTERM sorting signal [Dulcicalothrix desertica PCC 7102]